MAICWERAVPLAFHLCCFYFSVVLAVRVPFPFGVGAGCGIPLYRFLIIAFCLACFGKQDINLIGSTGVQLLVFFCSSVPVVLFDTPGISRCRSQHVSVESSSLFHINIYL